MKFFLAKLINYAVIFRWNRRCISWDFNELYLLQAGNSHLITVSVRCVDVGSDSFIFLIQQQKVLLLIFCDASNKFITRCII